MLAVNFTLSQSCLSLRVARRREFWSLFSPSAGSLVCRAFWNLDYFLDFDLDFPELSNVAASSEINPAPVVKSAKHAAASSIGKS